MNTITINVFVSLRVPMHSFASDDKIAIPMCSTYIAVRMRYFPSRREPQLALASCWTYELYNDQQDY